MMRKKPRKHAKDIHNSSHGQDNILNQVPPESRPNWEQCPNMGSVGFLLSFQKSSVLTFPTFGPIPPRYLRMIAVMWRAAQRKKMWLPTKKASVAAAPAMVPVGWMVTWEAATGLKSKWLVRGLKHTWTCRATGNLLFLGLPKPALLWLESAGTEENQRSKYFHFFKNSAILYVIASRFFP